MSRPAQLPATTRRGNCIEPSLPIASLLGQFVGRRKEDAYETGPSI